MILTRDSEWKLLDRLGRKGLVQLDDIHRHTQQTVFPFDAQLKDVSARLDKVTEIETILLNRGFLDEKESFNEEFNALIFQDFDSAMQHTSHSKFYNDMYDSIDHKYFRIKEQLNLLDSIETNISRTTNAIEALLVLKKQLPESFSKYERSTSSVSLALDYFSGTIEMESLFQIQKALFRITRGNAYVTYNTISKNRCCVFIAVQSTGSGGLKEKVSRICQSMDFHMVSVPNDANELAMTIEISKLDLLEMQKLQLNTKAELLKLLNKLSGESKHTPYSRVYQLKTLLIKETCLLQNLNRLVFGKTFNTLYFWMADNKASQFKQVLSDFLAEEPSSKIKHEKLDFEKSGKKAPTSFRTKGFFDVPQLIVDTYGVPRYKEANPGLFTSVSFPFLFGCMFGDIGHGFGVLVFALLMFGKPGWFPRQFLQARFIFLLMGLFAFWCGWVYNDFFAVPMLAMESCYTPTSEGGVTRNSEGCVYPLGLDHAWLTSKNEVPFLNSYKMKISIVYGVVQMVGGILIKGSNDLYFHNKTQFLTEFIPQLLFMLSTFGYMVFCIVMKWFTDFSADTSKAPAIIAIFMGLVSKVDNPLYGAEGQQETVQKTLVVITLLCVPVMLLGKPLVSILSGPKPKQSSRKSSAKEDDELVSLLSFEEHKGASHGVKTEEAHEDLSELFIHQGIETIEFVLGSVSNTASYLRIWALSLAHSELSRVFLMMLLKSHILGLNSVWVDGPMAIAMFTAFILVTIGVLMLMDLLECFLHTLRLHWVEFQSKFFKGDGAKFERFSFEEFIELNLK